MYSEFATDPKIQMLNEVTQRRYLMLLCLRCSNDHVTLHDDEVAFQLRISNEEYQETKSLLISKGLIGDDGKPSAWDKRQFVSDSSKSRVAKHREKKKQECNVTVTKSNALDTDTDTDTDNKSKPKKIPFENFYDKYPVKKSRAPAEKKWKGMTIAKQQLAIDGISKYLKTVDDLNFAVHPPTYLNQERWNDEVTAGNHLPANNQAGQLATRNVI